jgi:hypothetical protein
MILLRMINGNAVLDDGPSLMMIMINYVPVTNSNKDLYTLL